MCEINSHGGNMVVKKILKMCLNNGAELAEPGEFTKRAFLNGRIDLLQAESVIDIIHAKSEKEAKIGVRQLDGVLSKEIKHIKSQVLDVLVNIDVSIDYPEYDIEEVQNKEISHMLDNIQKELTILEKTFDQGKILKEGIKTAIVGRPNAGKSSLLNAILREDRAIVTEFEGTTRDTIEETATIEGIPLQLIDTAGIRNATDEVEKIGIEKAKEIAKEADLIIAIFDASQELNKEDLDNLSLIKGKQVIIALNKIDLPQKLNENDKRLLEVTTNIVSISAQNRVGLEELNKKILSLFDLEKIELDNSAVLTKIRHQKLIHNALEQVYKTKEAMKNNMPIDIIAISIKDILENLNEMTGEEVTENIINEIFSKFCLGK